MAASDDYIGKTIAQKYRIEQMIGEGGMGKVYKATQLLLEKQVVLKVLRQALLSDERTVRRFEREARAASRLNHPNSISILDFGRADDGSLYMAMEYVQGKDLHHILSREWPLPEARTIRIVSQVLSALADAHGAGVVHRDLKPENIMVEQRRGEPDFVKVLDFGIAKILDSSDDGPALTRAGFVCGTPEYMSPEQARGATLDHRSDLYAVGVILFQLTSGLLPFDSDSAVGFATKHLTEQPPLPTKRRPEARISSAMERLIMKSLAKSPDDRPQTAEQFRAELLAIDKERRAAGTPSRRGGSLNAPTPAPRKGTPVDQEATRISAESVTSNPWSAEETVRAAALRPSGAGPVPRPSLGAAQVTAPQRPELTVSTERPYPGSASALLFKVLTAVLVLAALGLAGAWAWEVHQQGEPKPPVLPVVVGASKAEPPKAAWDLEVPPGKRSVDEARRLRVLGDEAFTRAQFTIATDAYLRAFEQDPASDTALKLGELYFHQDRLADARGWWSRHLKDSPDSKAAAYIKARGN